MISRGYTFGLSLLFSLVVSFCFGQVQEDKPPQIIELKDGGRLLGTVIEDTDYAVTITILTGDTLIIGYKYISAVGSVDDYRVRPVGAKTVKKQQKPKSFIEKDLIKSLSIGASFQGEGGSGGFIGAADVIKMTNSRLGVGGGVSYTTHQKFFGFNSVNMSHLPVYVSSRYVFSGAKTLKPFVQLDLGYGLGINTSRFDFNGDYRFEGGAYSRIQFGTSIANRLSYNMTLSFSLLYQKTGGNIRGIDFVFGDPFESVFDLTIIRPGLSFGMAF